MIQDAMPSFGQAFYICEWLIRLAMLVVVPLRRSPAAACSWLLLIFFQPVPGLLLFSAIGNPRFPRWRTLRFERLQPMFAATAARLEGAAASNPAVKDVAALALRLGGMPAVGGNRAEFLDDYDRTIDRLVSDIDGARQHVRILVYIFADDAVGLRVIDALERAVGRGVSCHVLVDPVGSHHWIRGSLKRLSDAGVEARAILPFRFVRGRTRRDMRNHRKLFLIDGQIGYAGSQNIVAKDFRPGVSNRELVARIEGPAVSEMTAVFLADWFLETETMLEDGPAIPEPAGNDVIQVLPSGADYPLQGFETLLVWQIHKARERVVIVTPYFIPSDALLGAMRTAVARGVVVHLVVSAIADQKLVSLAQSSYYDEFLVSGVRIHRFRSYLLHAKNVSVDGRLAVLGSSNVDLRSFQLNEEVSLLLFDRDAIAGLEAIQDSYLTQSDEMDLSTWRERPKLTKLGGNLARLVSPLL